MSTQQNAPRKVASHRVTCDEAWPAITALLNKTIRAQLLNGEEPNLGKGASYAEYMQAYASAYNLGNGPLMSQYEELYVRLSRYWFDIADRMIGSLPKPATDNPALFLRAYIEAYERYLGAAMLQPRLFKLYNSVFLQAQADRWLKPRRAPGSPDVPPGSELVNPNPPVITVSGGMRHQQAVPIQDLVPRPIPRAAIDEDIMRWDKGKAEGAPPGADIARLIWPPQGKVVPTSDSAIDARDTAQHGARKHASLPANAVMPIVPTILRLWRNATVKHYGDESDPSFASIVYTLTAGNDIDSELETIKSLAKAFWATGVLEEDLGFADLVQVLRPKGE